MPDEAIDVAALQQAVQSKLDAVTRKLGLVGEIVTGSIRAGGNRATRGQLGLPHLEDAMAVLSVVSRNNKGRNPDEYIQEINMVDRCLRRAADAMTLDYDQL